MKSESEDATVDHPLEDKSLESNVDPSEEDPPIIEDPDIEQGAAVRNGQTRRQMMRRLLWKKQGMRMSEDDIDCLGNLD